MNLTTRLGSHELATPLVAASGTVGSVVDFAAVGALEAYGAATAKSVAPTAWPGRDVPRVAAAGVGMLNSIGIQNPGIDAWADVHASHLHDLPTEVWGSAVGAHPEEFALVAKGLEAAGVAAVEVNLSCPNIEGEGIFALDPAASAAVIGAVRSAVTVPIGAKLSPNAIDIAEIAGAVSTAGADWVVLTNTALGLAIDIETGRPVVSGNVAGYSGAPLKPIVMRCVWEVASAHPELPIVGLGGVRTGEDVVEYLMAGASAVGLGTVHFSEPRAGARILREFERWCARHGVGHVDELRGTIAPW